jgi:hypothetical protein
VAIQENNTGTKINIVGRWRETEINYWFCTLQVEELFVGGFGCLYLFGIQSDYQWRQSQTNEEIEKVGGGIQYNLA